MQFILRIFCIDVFVIFAGKNRKDLTCEPNHF